MAVTVSILTSEPIYKKIFTDKLGSKFVVLVLLVYCALTETVKTFSCSVLIYL